jgi:hypothetical protein
MEAPNRSASHRAQSGFPPLTPTFSPTRFHEEPHFLLSRHLLPLERLQKRCLSRSFSAAVFGTAIIRAAALTATAGSKQSWNVAFQRCCGGLPFTRHCP